MKLSLALDKCMVFVRSLFNFHNIDACLKRITHGSKNPKKN